MRLWRHRGLPVKERVVVNTVDGGTADGILLGDYPDWIVLAHASLIGETTVQVDGQMWIPRHSVLFLQRPDTGRLDRV